MNAQSHPDTPTIAAGIGVILRSLAALIARRFLHHKLHAALIIPLWQHFTQAALRLDRLRARLAAGPLPPPKPRAHHHSGPHRKPIFPTTRAWLIRALGPEAATYAAQLESLLADPANADLLASPAARRTLAPFAACSASPPPAHTVPPSHRQSPPPRRHPGQTRSRPAPPSTRRPPARAAPGGSRRPPCAPADPARRDPHHSAPGAVLARPRADAPIQADARHGLDFPSVIPQPHPISAQKMSSPAMRHPTGEAAPNVDPGVAEQPIHLLDRMLGDQAPGQGEGGPISARTST